MPEHIKLQLPTDCPIEPKWFYLSDNEKNKFAWFHYEYACAYYNKIMESRKQLLKRWIRERSKEQLAEFCAYFSKRMQKNMYELIEGLSSVITCEAQYIRDYCHRNTIQENAELTGQATQAIVWLLEICRTCPVQCLDDPSGYCEFFDRYSI